MTSNEVLTALANKFAPPEYAFLAEVRNSVGFTKARTADAMAMSLWPSRGLYMTGFEIKVSRADWKRELEQPEKAEAMARFCRHWFIACPDRMIEVKEVPSGWGLIYVKDEKVRFAKPAPENAAEEPTWMLFASLMRDITEQWVPASLVEQRVAKAVDEKRKQIERSQGYEFKQAKEQVAEMTARIQAFEESSGIKMDKYSEYFQGEIGKAVAAIRRWGSMPLDQLATMQANVGRLEREIGEVIQAIKEGR